MGASTVLALHLTHQSAICIVRHAEVVYSFLIQTPAMNVRLAIEDHGKQRLTEIDTEIAQHLTALRSLTEERTMLVMHQFVSAVTTRQEVA